MTERRSSFSTFNIKLFSLQAFSSGEGETDLGTRAGGGALALRAFGIGSGLATR